MNKKKKYKIEYIGNVDNVIVEKWTKFSKKFIAISRKYLYIHNIEQLHPSTFILYYKDQEIIPFWKDELNEISKNIFLPSNENIVVDEKIQTEYNKNKWFNSSFNIEKGTHLNNIEYEPSFIDSEIIKVVKIKLFVTPIQLNTLKKFMSVYRYFYNRTISYCNNINKTTNESYYLIIPNDENTKITVKCPRQYYNWISLKKILYENQPEWIKNIKYNSHSCKQAIKEALTNVTTNIKRYKKNNKPFKMKFKAKKDLINTLILEKDAINNNTLFYNYSVNKEKIFRNMKISGDIDKYDYGGSTLSYHRILKAVILNLTYKSRTKENSNNKVCAVDKGETNFVTIYSDNNASKLGMNCDKKIYKICKEIDIIHSRIDKKEYYVKNKNNEKIIKTVNAERRRNLKKALHRKIQYIKNLRDELHNQVINYLTVTYSKIITSPFETQGMVCNLNCKVARMMNTLSFYKFQQKLEHKCQERNCELVTKSEAYTTMTCTRCGNLKYNVGSNKVYHCDKCGLTLERDYNGARNIMLRNNY